MRRSETPAPPAESKRDSGFSIIEILISMVVLGVIMSVLSVAISVSLRAAPDTETRLDDARATRSLSTWLANDTISAPPFMPEQAQGGIIVDQAVTANNNDCGSVGTNLLHLQWTEVTNVTLTFVANYRFQVDGADASIIRHLCSKQDSDPFTIVTRRTMTSGLTPSQIPTITPVVDGITGNVTSIKFELTGQSGEIVFVETGSRNPADFFP